MKKVVCLRVDISKYLYFQRVITTLVDLASRRGFYCSKGNDKPDFFTKNKEGCMSES